jgi:hypothetical protein
MRSRRKKETKKGKKCGMNERRGESVRESVPCYVFYCDRTASLKMKSNVVSFSAKIHKLY